MVDRPGLSKGEMTVARILWEQSSSSVRQVHEALPANQSMDIATVQTYLRRLEAKGYATSVLNGRIRIYKAKTKAKTVIRQTVDDLVARLFGGPTMPLVRHLIEDHGINADDLVELRKLIDRMQDEERKS